MKRILYITVQAHIFDNLNYKNDKCGSRLSFDPEPFGRRNGLRLEPRPHQVPLGEDQGPGGAVGHQPPLLHQKEAEEELL